MIDRPGRLIVVLGTATGVGKTWLTAAAVGSLRSAGVAATARKPVQSYSPDEAGATDAHVLAAASGEGPEAVCPRHRWYEAPMAPPMAAGALGCPPFTVGDLVAELRWPGPTRVGLVETVGGPRSPVALDGDSLDLAAALHPDLLVVVADAGLGALNAVLLSTEAAARTVPDVPVAVFLNRYRQGDDLAHRNLAWLRDDGLDVVTTVDDVVARLG